MRNPRSSLLFIAALLCTAGSVLLWFFYFAMYWPYRSLFNEAGRYMDPSTLVVYHEQSGLLAIPAMTASILAVVFACFWRAGQRLHNTKPELRS